MMQVESRAVNSIRNISVALIGQLIGLVLTFVTRIFFIRHLGVGYLGLNGFFSNILSFLSLAEMGFGASLLVSLYKPIQMNNQLLISQYINHFKKVYAKIGIFTLIVGSVMAFFIPDLIKEDSVSSVFTSFQILQYYFIFLINSVIPYFFLVDRFLVIAFQKKFIVSIIRYSAILILNIAQVFTLIFMGSFFIYLLLALIMALLEFIVIRIWVKRTYTFLRRDKNLNLTDSQREQITIQVKSMVFHKITGILIASLPSILLTSFIGLESTGKYSNYLLIFTGLNIVFSQIFDGVNASVGSFAAQKEPESIHDLFKTMFFVNAWLYNFATIGLILFLQDVIHIFFGSDLLYNQIIVYAIIVNFYINGLRRTLLTFRDAMGLFVFDRNKAIVEAILAIILSYLFLVIYQEFGIFIGISLSTILTCYLVEPYILYNKVFGLGSRNFYKILLKYILVGIFAFILSYLSIMFVEGKTIFFLVLRIAIVTGIVNVFHLIVFRKTREFRKLKTLVVGLIQNQRKST